MKSSGSVACKNGSMASIIGTVLVIILVKNSMGQRQKIDGAIDIVAVLNVGVSSQPNSNDRETRALKEAYAEFFPDNFEMRRTKTRIGVVQVTGTRAGQEQAIRQKIVSELTYYDQPHLNRFNDMLIRWSPHTLWDGGKLVFKPNFHEALGAIQRIIHAYDGSRAKIVIMVVNSVTSSSEWDKTHRLANEIRGTGVKFYVIAVAQSDHEFQRIMDEAGNYTGDQARVIISGRPTLEKPSLLDALKKIRNAIIRDLCGNSICRYGRLGTDCRSGRVSPSLFSINCDALVSPVRCTDDDCSRLCDDHWPWTDCTSDNCGTIGRQGNEPRKGDQHMKDYVKSFCPRSRLCPCPTTTTTTTTTTLSTSTSSTTKSTSQSTTSTTKSTKSTSGSTKPRSSPSPKSSTTAKQRTTPAEPTIARRQTTNVENQITETPDVASSPAVVFTVMGIIVLLVIILVVVGFIVSKKDHGRSTYRKNKKKSVATESSSHTSMKSGGSSSRESEAKTIGKSEAKTIGKNEAKLPQK